MDKLRSVHEKKATKHSKTTKKSVKVVYISNPMKVKTSASEFRALVQQLTGQDSTFPEPVVYWPEMERGHQIVPAGGIKVSTLDYDPVLHVPRALEPAGDDQVVLHKRSDVAPGPYDFVVDVDDDDDDNNVFSPTQMLENFSDGSLLPSNYLYDQSLHHQVMIMGSEA